MLCTHGGSSKRQYVSAVWGTHSMDVVGAVCTKQGRRQCLEQRGCSSG